MAIANMRASEFGDTIYSIYSLLATHWFIAVYTEYKYLHSQEGIMSIMSAYSLKKHLPIPTWHESAD